MAGSSHSHGGVKNAIESDSFVFTNASRRNNHLPVQSSEAMATYFFNVKVVNNSGQDIEIRYISWKAKGNSLSRSCSEDDVRISAGSSTVKPRCIADVQKWQRQIQVSINCKSSGATRNLYFPRGSKKFFARDYAQKNGDKYITKIKTGDC